MMPTALHEFERAGLAEITGERIVFNILPTWASQTEKRIGYVGVLRLVECVRELHWRRDVLPLSGSDLIDSITRSLDADFRAPIEVGMRVTGRYSISWCRARSYGLSVGLSCEQEDRDLARVDLVNVFFDPNTNCSTFPPDRLAAALRTQVVVDQ